MMKQIIILLLTLFFSFSGITQTPFSIQIEVADSAKSIFCQSRTLLKIPDPVTIDSVTGERTNHLTALRGTYKFFVKFPNTDWFSISENRKENSTSEVTSTVTKLEGFVYTELFPLFLDRADIFETVKRGTTMELRFQIYVSEDDGPFHYVYSNIENIYLPPANEDDINAMNYVRDYAASPKNYLISSDSQHRKDIDDYIIEHFPGSIVAEWALIKNFSTLSQKKFLTMGNSDTYRQWKNDYISTMKPTIKSDRAYDYFDKQ